MTDATRIKVAALVVALFLAAVSAAGLLSHAVAPGAGVTGQVRSAVHASPGSVQINSHTFEHDSND